MQPVEHGSTLQKAVSDRFHVDVSTKVDTYRRVRITVEGGVGPVAGA